MTPNEQAEEQQVRELLRTLERDGRQISDRRTAILRDVLAHYERSRGRTVADFGTVEPTRDAPATRRSMLLLTASVAAVVMIAGLAFLSSGRGEAPTADTLPPPVESAETVTVAAGRVTIRVPDGLRIVRNEDRVVLIARDPDATSIADAIVVVDHGVGDFGSEVERLFSTLNIQQTSSGSNVDGRRFDRWSITLTQVGSSEFGCAAGDECLELVADVPETALEPGRRVSVTELVTTDGRVVLVMADEDGPLRADLGALLAEVNVD